MAPMRGDAAAYEIPESLTTSFYHLQSSREPSPPTAEQLLSQYGRPCPRSVDREPGSSREPNRCGRYIKNRTVGLSVKIKKHHFFEAMPSMRATSAWDLERGSQAQPQLGPHSTGRAQLEAEVVDATEHDTVSCRGHFLTNTGYLASAGSDKEDVRTLSPRTTPTKLTDNISGDQALKDTHATEGDSFARLFEPDTSSPHIILHREAADGRLEFLLWSPIWFLEDALANIAPDQLNLYTELASGASQARKRARSPSPKPRRSLRPKKPLQC
ncbi:hypothetical protein ACJ73_06367 [Blastomyces percursus]|uniref:Uncharacterized protein n=1 Tax=Blastomyces percursus TaxID=1658174 RepID=A0A1J9R3T9_9EURO|nr:hypothetical protein ACJ73_06367 [Blastomyces percursus]